MTNPAHAETPPRITRRGDRGTDVAVLQRYLLRWGGEPARMVAGSGGADGIHGEGTDRAVIAWHFERGFAPDGNDADVNYSERNENIPSGISGPAAHESSAELNDVAGIDISHHQPPSLLRWDLLARDYAFCIARACYGTSADRHFARHIADARAAGLRVGAYMFFRQQQSVDAQLASFQAQMDLAHIAAGDIVPALDLEYNDSGADGPVDAAAHNAKGERIADVLATEYGDCLVYMSPSHYVTLGRPQWLERFSPWVAHYTAADEPSWPAYWPAWAVWQRSGSHRHVGFRDGAEGAYLDLNWARRLPLVR